VFFKPDDLALVLIALFYSQKTTFMHYFQDSIKKALVDAFPELTFSFLGICPPLCFSSRIFA